MPDGSYATVDLSTRLNELNIVVCIISSPGICNVSETAVDTREREREIDGMIYFT